MLFDVPSRVEDDPAREECLAWAGVPMRLPWERGATAD
jgi:hypothetical protein